MTKVANWQNNNNSNNNMHSTYITFSFNQPAPNSVWALVFALTYKTFAPVPFL